MPGATSGQHLCPLCEIIDLDLQRAQDRFEDLDPVVLSFLDHVQLHLPCPPWFHLMTWLEAQKVYWEVSWTKTGRQEVFFLQAE